MAAHTAGQYYDIIMVGRTGVGKRTLANKLLNILPLESELSVTYMYHRQRLLINDEIKIRVLDTPGLASSGLKPGVTIYESNLNIFRCIVREQLNPNTRMSAHRLLYFLPNRGVFRKADGCLLEEVKVMHHFFGPAVFNNMVVIATHDVDYQDRRFTNEQCIMTQKVFFEALSRATKNEMKRDECPPVLYIGLNDTHEEVLQAVKIADVPNNAFQPAFCDDVCSRCSIKTRYSKAERKMEPIGVINGDNFEKYEESKCHPEFIQKYSTGEKVASGFGHIITVGTALVYEKITGKDTWPGFTSSDEICPSCKQVPGSKGCCTVQTECKIPGTRGVKVDHTNKL